MTDRQLYDDCLKLKPEQRAVYLTKACGTDDAQRQRVEHLLMLQESMPGLLNKPTEDEPTPAAGTQAYVSAPGTEIAPGATIAGRYKIMQELGEGGMGTVYVAEQREPVKRLVALKLIKTGMNSKVVHTRFEAERQALALMDHPNIARMLDGGITDNGQPYFVMELVKGVPINKFCDQEHLTPKERLELFIPVCQAVHHAHQKGIIHRDLKPSNILVGLYDGKPVAKVIDFGVAKAVHQKLTERTMYTEVGSIIGTLEYMAPEQAELNNLDIDTRADIYALGVILYELLTGSTPFSSKQLREAAFDEMLRMIREEEPQKPSTKLSSSEKLPSIAANRKLEPKQLTAMVAGELDWIVMKCLEKDRVRRYESANALSCDIQRYLTDEVVEARPPSTSYRLNKFISRNKGQVIAASLVLAALVAGTVGTTLGMMEAMKQESLAREETKAKEKARVAEVEQRQAAEYAAAAEKSAREQIQRQLTQIERGVELFAGMLAGINPRNEDKEGKTLYDQLRERAEKVADQLLQDTVADPLVESRLQTILGDTLRELGGHSKSIELLNKAWDTRKRALGSEHINTLLSKANLASSFLKAGRTADAIPLLEQVRDVFVKKLGMEHNYTIISLHNLASAYHDAGQTSNAIALYEQVRDLRITKLGVDNKETLITLNNLVTAYQSAGRTRDAIALIKQVQEGLANKLGASHPDTLTSKFNLAFLYKQSGQTTEAMSLALQVHEARKIKLGAEHLDTLSSQSLLASLYLGSERTEDAIGLIEQVRSIKSRKLGSDHPYTLETTKDLAKAFQAAKRTTEAISLFKQIIDIQMKKLGAQHPNTLTSLCDLASAYRDAGRLKDAIDVLEQVRKNEIETLGADHPSTLTTLNNLAACYWSQKRLEKSIPLFEDVKIRREKLLGRQHPDTLNTIANLGVNYRDAGRLKEAILLLEEVHQASKRHSSLSRFANALLDCYLKAGRSPDAAKLIDELLIQARKEMNSPQLAGQLALFGMSLLQINSHDVAEPLLRECLAIREKTQPDLWSTFNTNSLLGGALMGQKKYLEAESLLLKGYEGMKAREKTIPAQGVTRIPESIDRLIQLYTETNKPEEAVKWRKELDAHNKKNPPPAPEKKP